jgi:SAM-dependent methyltransferase
MAQLEDRPSTTNVPDVTPEWIDPHLPGVFARGHRYLEPLQRESAQAIIAAAGIEPGYHVIDIAPGSGIPTFMVATAVGPGGRVVAVDPAPVCVETVRDHASERGLQQVEAVQGSAATLPFPAGSFDAAVCHMGVMFFPDLRAGLTRIREVLRPGCRAAFAAWGPVEENTMMRTYFGVAASYLPPPPPIDGDPADTPFPMRFARAGTLGAALSDAGYADVREEMILATMVWPGPPATMRDFWMEMANAGAVLEPDRQQAFAADLDAALAPLADARGIHFAARIVIASGANPA